MTSIRHSSHMSIRSRLYHHLNLNIGWIKWLNIEEIRGQSLRQFFLDPVLSSTNLQCNIYSYYRIILYITYVLYKVLRHFTQQLDRRSLSLILRVQQSQIQHPVVLRTLKHATSMIQIHQNQHHDHLKIITNLSGQKSRVDQSCISILIKRQFKYILANLGDRARFSTVCMIAFQ